MVIDPAWWEQPDMRAALAVRDIGEVYRTLTSLGVSQRQIATLVGQSQSEVSEIVKGRVVKDSSVLERIAEGLGIPRERMGLSW
ncbi:MAG: helix-turn-helix domain-containing protein [Pseudonocardiaceae bacterium]